MQDAAAAFPPVEHVMQRALQGERLRSARRVALIRLVAVGLVLALSAWLALVAGDDSWRANLELLLAYFGAAVLLTAVAWRVAAAERWDGLAIAGLDIPAVY